MIDSIRLENFQSHKDVTLEFSPGINIFTGESDQGKTAILRGLYLARYNKPSIDPMISHWALNDKGNQKDTTSITVVKDGVSLKREKSTKFNGYDLNGKKFSALGKGGLPEEVLSFFDMTEVNIQKQMDGPFLIGQSPSEIAKFLNTIVDMTEIDEYLHAVLVKKNSNNKELKRFVTEIQDLEKQIEVFNSLEDAELLLKKLGKIQKRVSLKNEDIATLETLMESYTTLQEQLATDSDFKQIEKLLKKAASIIPERKNKVSSIKSLQKLVNSYEDTELELSESEDTVTLEGLLKKIDPIIKKRQVSSERERILQKLVQDYEEYTDIIFSATEKIETLEVKLPAICPTCLQKWKKED